MRSFLKGFLSVFDFGAAFAPRRSVRLEKILRNSQKPFSWYHKGEWWEHPIYGDAWKDKDV